MSIKMYVGNLSYQLTEAELSELFAPFGEVENVKIVTDRYTGNSKGFGFVEMAEREDGESAISALNGKTVNNRAIIVDAARPKEPRSDFRNGGNNWRD